LVIPSKISTLSISSSKVINAHQECTLETLVAHAVQVSSGDLIAPSSSSSKSCTMNVESIRIQF
jgi:hypothetical protein